MKSYRSYQGRRRSARRTLLTVLPAIVLAGVIVFLGLLTAVLAGAEDELVGEPDVVMVFGCRMQADGTPTPMLQARLDRALTYLEMNPDAVVLVTGGRGSGETVSEADCMAEYLTDNGVDSGRILQEECATSTWENIRLGQELLLEAGIPTDEILAVSSGFHLTRIRLLFGRAWEGEYTLSVLAASSGGFFDIPWMYLREMLALTKDFLFRR